MLSMISRSVAWVARDMVGSLISKTLPAESKTRLPLVVVLIVKSPEVASRIPADTKEISAPVPELVISRTAPLALA